MFTSSKWQDLSASWNWMDPLWWAHITEAAFLLTAGVSDPANQLKVSQKPSCGDWKEWLSRSCLNLETVSEGNWPWLCSLCLARGSWEWLIPETMIPILPQIPSSDRGAEAGWKSIIDGTDKNRGQASRQFLWEVTKFSNKTFTIHAGISSQPCSQGHLIRCKWW